MGADALVARRVARRHGNTAAVRLLWQKAFPMHYACSKGEAEVVEAWLRAGSIDVNACDWKGRTLLHEASRGGHALLVRTLLGAQARVDAEDDACMTPLRMAARAPHVDVFRELVSAGADACAAMHAATHASGAGEAFDEELG